MSTIKDVATKAGVSISTVSHVLNKTRFVSEETVVRVKNAIEELGYRSNNIARSLRNNKSYRIGLLVPEISNFFSIDIIESIEKIVRTAGYQLVIGYSHDKLEIEKEQIAFFDQQMIDGLILFPCEGDHSYLEENLCNYPIVAVDRKPENFICDYVGGANEEAVYAAITKMIEEGHRKIGMVIGPKALSPIVERAKGYYRALSEHGIEIEKNLIQIGGSDFESGMAMTECLLQEKGLTAIFAGNNILTLGALSCLQQHAIHIPKQIALLGVGDTRWATVSNPPLSVLRHPMSQIGAKAAEIIMDRINGADGEAVVYQFPVELVRRVSF